MIHARKRQPTISVRLMMAPSSIELHMKSNQSGCSPSGHTMWWSGLCFQRIPLQNSTRGSTGTAKLL